ncbi:MAG TPA: hypothetical protein PLR06_03655 [Cyclobacteriaceae bacterium]|nr:hypothetical protein [Cyclobacteriaceae bacterium]
MNKRRIAFSLLFYCCIFIADDSPFTSFWDYLPDVQAENAFCSEEQEESLPIVTFLKIRSNNSHSSRASFHTATVMLLSFGMRSKNFNWTRTASSVRTSRQDLSIDYCTFRI